MGPKTRTDKFTSEINCEQLHSVSHNNMAPLAYLPIDIERTSWCRQGSMGLNAIDSTVNRVGGAASSTSYELTLEANCDDIVMPAVLATTLAHPKLQ